MSQPELSTTLGIPSSALQQAALRYLARQHLQKSVTPTKPQTISEAGASTPLRRRSSDSEAPETTAPNNPAAALAAIANALPSQLVTNQDIRARPTPFIPNRREFTLAFRHDCLNLGCAESQCQLCSHAQARHCTRTFCTKYLVGDNLKASCGAAIRIAVVDKSTGQSLRKDSMSGIKLEIVLLNAKTINFTKQGASVLSSAELDAAMVPTHQGRPLLQSAFEGQDRASLCCEYDKEGRAVLPFRGTEVLLSGLMVTGSSEAILTGQRPQFVLLARAIDTATGTALPNVMPLFSEGFVVATSRVRTAVKKDIPHCNDPVSKLNALGKATQDKLCDLRQAALDAGYADMVLPINSVTTVAEFRELVQWAIGNKERLKALKKLLKLTRGWDEAVEHAMTAVEDDTLLRAWWGGGVRQPALVFAANKGTPLLDGGPVGK